MPLNQLAEEARRLAEQIIQLITVHPTGHYERDETDWEVHALETTDFINKMVPLITTALLQAQRAAFDKGELWVFCRSILSQGHDISLDYAAGKYKCYEEYSARLDAAARERTDEFAAAIRQRGSQVK